MRSLAKRFDIEVMPATQIYPSITGIEKIKGIRINVKEKYENLFERLYYRDRNEVASDFILCEGDILERAIKLTDRVIRLNTFYLNPQREDEIKGLWKLAEKVLSKFPG